MLLFWNSVSLLCLIVVVIEVGCFGIDNLVLSGNLTIERYICKHLIRGKEKESKSAGEDTEENPADEAEVQAEKTPFVSVHNSS